MPANQRYPQFSDANLKGAFFAAFDDAMAPSYLNSAATRIDSDKASEAYGWLGTVPVMREWKGGRQKNQLNEFDWTLYNTKYESSLGISVDDVRRDKTGQFVIRAAQMGLRAAENPIILLSDLLDAGESTACFDGQYFFDTDHVEGNSGSQSNIKSVDISELPVSLNGTVTAPSPEEMMLSILQGIKQFYLLKDDQGQPVNQTAQEFDLIYPVGLMDAALSALSDLKLGAGRDNTLAQSKFKVNPYCDPRLSWTDQFALLRADHPVKSFLHQVEVDNEITTITDPNSEYVAFNDEYFFGVKRIETVGYGDYKKAVLVQMT